MARKLNVNYENANAIVNLLNYYLNDGDIKISNVIKLIETFKKFGYKPFYAYETELCGQTLLNFAKGWGSDKDYVEWTGNTKEVTKLVDPYKGLYKKFIAKEWKFTPQIEKLLSL